MKNNLKKFIIGLVGVIVIFVAYYYLQPMGKGISVLEKKDYELKTYNIEKNNKWATFRDDGDGTFFMHPGEQKPTVAVFALKDSSNILLDFWVREGSKVGDIKFGIFKNSKLIKNINVTAKKNKHVYLSLSIKDGDRLKIEADKHGEINSDWGQLKISKQDKLFNFKNFIIPFLWAILFIFLVGKKHKYIAMTAYILFVLMVFAEKLNFGFMTFQHLLTYTIFIFALTFSFVFVYQELWKLKRFKVATIFSFSIAFLVYIIPLFFILYALNFNKEVTKDILFAVFQSNSDESYAYISDYISSVYIGFFIFFTAMMGYLLHRQEKKETTRVDRSLLVFVIITFFSISLTQFSNLRLPHFVMSGFKKYDKELRLFKQVQEKRKAGEIKFNASKKTKGETYIFIIGESLNRRHMGIYGYLRDTTPALSEMKKNGELTVFTNAYSNHTHTVPVLSLALTEANQYNKKSYYNSLSIIDILKKADIDTYWLTNQAIYGAWDNMVSVIGTSADHLVSMNKHIGEQVDTSHLDGDLINELKKVLEVKTDKDRVIFIHLIGNHFDYSTRYPHDTYTIYKGALKKGEFGANFEKMKHVNEYDNSVAYNDFVVSSIIKTAQKANVLTVMYMSDHTDDVINNLGHNSGNFTFYMTQIPFMAWFSDTYKKRYQRQYNNLIHHKDTLFSNDMLYDTLVGTFGIKTDRYNAKYDFSSSKYQLKPEDALTLHGKKHYADKSNSIYWQKVNARYLRDTNQSKRIFPHRVDSLGKLHDIWNDGFRAFEIDVHFSKKENVFYVGHDSTNSLSLKFFLENIDASKIERIWLDFKNLNNKNAMNALKYLNTLDKQFHIKNKFIVESGTILPFFSNFSNDGWHTSYYLPTNDILAIIHNQDEMEKKSKVISKQLEIQKVSAVSFDDRLYPFVKQYLEPKISQNIVYHIWYAPPLYSATFKKDLQNSKLYQDTRIKTLLTSYKSQFNF